MGRRWHRTIFGQPVSKANSRRIAHVGRGKAIRVIKSAKALGYVADVHKQVPVLRKMLEGRLRFTATLCYENERSDLDASLLLDCLQGRIYENDRQVREIHLYHGCVAASGVPFASVLVEEIG